MSHFYNDRCYNSGAGVAPPPLLLADAESPNGVQPVLQLVLPAISRFCECAHRAAHSAYLLSVTYKQNQIRTANSTVN